VANGEAVWRQARGDRGARWSSKERVTETKVAEPMPVIDPVLRSAVDNKIVKRCLFGD
jgi:hypothetical protein